MKQVYILLILSVFTFSSVFARKITLDKREHISIEGDFEFFEDVNGEHSIETIRTQNFQKSKKKDPSFGLTNSVYWLRFTEQLPNTDLDLFKLELNNTLIEDLQLYTFDASNEDYTLQLAGRVLPFAQRAYPLKSFVFDLPNDGNKHEYYIRVKSLYTMAFPIEFARYSAMSEIENDRQILYGFIFGLIFLVGIYNFLMYMFIKEKVYLIYIAYLLVFGFYNVIFVGLDVQYIYPNLVWWPQISASVFAALSVVFACIISSVFLATKEHVKKIDKVLIVFIMLGILLAIIPFFSINITYKKIITLFPVIIFVPTIWAAIIRIRQGFTPAILYLCGWACLGVGIVLYGLRSAQLIESNLFTSNSILFGVVFEMLFLSGSLAYKFKLIKKENDAAKEDRINYLEEVKTLKDKANKELELKVIERTKEVIKQKDELTTKNKHIVDSINYAKRLQDALLPNPESLGSVFEDFFILYKPKDIISGDFYWFYNGSDSLFLVVADCTGHGVPGALMSILGHSYLNEIVKENQELRPGQILKLLHEKVNLALQKGGTKFKVNDGMDLSILKVNKATKHTEFSGAKRPIWLINGEVVEIMKGSKYPIGGGQYGDDYEYQTIDIYPRRGSSCILFTDGFPDQFGGKEGKKFMTKTFREQLISTSDLSMSEQKEYLNTLFDSWKGDLEQTDDVLVIGIRF